MQQVINKEPVVGEIIEVKRHPNADRLFIARVNVGNSDPISVIFGGNRVLKPGDLVPVALPGTRLKDGSKIRPRNYRKIRSNAEILDRDELCGSTGYPCPDEVFVLPKGKYTVGKPITVTELI